MALDPIIPEARREAAAAAGLWGDRLIIDGLDELATARPDDIAAVCHQVETGSDRALTYGEIRQMSERSAAGLLRLGVRPGDVVAAQLPGWWHYFVLYPACARIGAAFNPLMPIFRQRELRFMLGFPKTKVLIVPSSFRGFDYPAMIDSIRSDLPDLQHVIVAGSDGPEGFEDLLLDRLLAPVLDQRAVPLMRWPRRDRAGRRSLAACAFRLSVHS